MTRNTFVERVLIVAAVVVALIAAWAGRHVLLILFAAALLAIFLRRSAVELSDRTPLSVGGSVAAVAGAAVLLAAAFGWLVIPRLVDEISQAGDVLPKTVESLEGMAEGIGIDPGVLDRLREGMGTSSAGKVATGLGSVAAGTAAFFTDLVLLTAIGLFLALAPRRYKHDLIAMAPKGRKEWARAKVEALGETLWRWLIGQVVASAAVAVLVGIGLVALGVPLSLLLAVIAGIFNIIPFFGPLLTAVPAMLIALTVDPLTALWVALLFAAVQFAEGYFLHPLIMKRAVSLPPAITIVSVSVFGAWFGLMGLFLGMPLAVAANVLVRETPADDEG